MFPPDSASKSRARLYGKKLSVPGMMCLRSSRLNKTVRNKGGK
jgi:hypothetical protein